MNTAIRNLSLALVSVAVLSACATTGGSYTYSDASGNPTQQQNKTGRNAAIGAGIGVLAGLLSGDSATERRQHAMVGAGIGALGGAAIGAGTGAIVGGIAGGGRGAAIGAAVGGVTGAVIGRATTPNNCLYRDRQGRVFEARCP